MCQQREPVCPGSKSQHQQINNSLPHASACKGSDLGVRTLPLQILLENGEWIRTQQKNLCIKGASLPQPRAQLESRGGTGTSPLRSLPLYPRHSASTSKKQIRTTPTHPSPLNSLSFRFWRVQLLWSFILKKINQSNCKLLPMFLCRERKVNCYLPKVHRNPWLFLLTYFHSLPVSGRFHWAFPGVLPDPFSNSRSSLEERLLQSNPSATTAREYQVNQLFLITKSLGTGIRHHDKLMSIWLKQHISFYLVNLSLQK